MISQAISGFLNELIIYNDGKDYTMGKRKVINEDEKKHNIHRHIFFHGK